MRDVGESVSSDPVVVVEALWREHARELTRFAAVLVGPHDATQLATDAIVRAGRRLEITHIADIRAYLFRSVSNAARDYGRRQSRQRRNDLAGAIASKASMDSPEWDPDVARAVMDLSVRQRSIVYLAYWEDLSERAIAQRLGLHVGTVHRHLSRAHRHLRKALQ